MLACRSPTQVANHQHARTHQQRNQTTNPRRHALPQRAERPEARHAVLMEISEDWETNRIYLTMETN